MCAFSIRSQAGSACVPPEICLPADLEFACGGPWETVTAKRQLSLPQKYSATYIHDQVAEGLSAIDAQRLSRGEMRGGELSRVRWRTIHKTLPATLVHNAVIEETAVLECVKHRPILTLHRSAWVTRFQIRVHIQDEGHRYVTPDIRARRQKDRFDLSQGKVSAPVLKTLDSRVNPASPKDIAESFDFIRSDFPTGVSFRDARNYFADSFDEFLRFDSPAVFSLRTNVEKTQLMLLNEKGEILIRFRRSLSPFRYTDAEGRITSSLTQELQAARAYLQGLEGTLKERPLPLMEAESYAPYRTLAMLLQAALQSPSPQAVATLHDRLKQDAWTEVSKDLTLVEVGSWVKGFVEHVEAAYRISRP